MAFSFYGEVVLLSLWEDYGLFLICHPERSRGICGPLVRARLSSSYQVICRLGAEGLRVC